MGIFKRKPREQLVAELGEDIVGWGEKVAGLYDELPPDDGAAKLDDARPPKRTGPVIADKPETIHTDEKGMLMKCTVCKSPFTVDGRTCRRHM